MDYGACDVSSDVLVSMCETFYRNKVCVTAEQRADIERETRHQSQCNRWFEERRNRITASNAKTITCMRVTTSTTSKVRQLLYPRSTSTDAMDWGKAQEVFAKAKYENLMLVKVDSSGLWVDSENPFLAASPDGIVNLSLTSSYVVEIKCPYNARHLTSIREACEAGKIPLAINSTGEFYLPPAHAHFFQVQLQLQCCDMDRCDYVVFIPNDIAHVTVRRDREFMSNIIPKLRLFYMDCILPELVDSRAQRGLPLREPQRIIDARKEKEAKTAKGNYKK